MKKKTIFGIALGVAMVVVLGGMVLSTNWSEDTGMGDTPEEVKFFPDDVYEFDPSNYLPFAMFETYGPLMLVVTLLLFGAIIGSAALAKEEEEEE